MRRPTPRRNTFNANPRRAGHDGDGREARVFAAISERSPGDKARHDDAERAGWQIRRGTSRDCGFAGSFFSHDGEQVRLATHRYAVNRGEALFHSAGCVACHDPRLQQPAEPAPASIPLGTPSKKYTLAGLTQFLHEPLAVRPGGRMPDLNLSAAEARDVASFLLNDLDIVAGLHYAYYEGEWDKLPKFDTLTPVATGDAENFDLSPAKSQKPFRPAFRGDHSTAPRRRISIPNRVGRRFTATDRRQSHRRRRRHPSFRTKAQEGEDDGGHALRRRRSILRVREEALQVDFEGPGGLQQPLDSPLTCRWKNQRAPARHPSRSQSIHLRPRRAGRLRIAGLCRLPHVAGKRFAASC